MSSKTTTPKAASSSLEEVENTVSRLSGLMGVLAVMILSTPQGEIIQSSFTNQVEQAKILLKVNHYCASLFVEEEVTFIRIRTQQHELLIAPNKEYLLVVLHNPLISTTIENAI